jgi:hypothetical protein
MFTKNKVIFRFSLWYWSTSSGILRREIHEREISEGVMFSLDGSSYNHL